jgi:hypothetical protein
VSGRPPHDVGPHWGEVGIHGMHRLREWDAVVTVEAAGPAEDELEFVALPDGRAVPAEAAALVAALEQEQPYRARAVRRGDLLWAVAIRRIRVEERLEPGDEFEHVEEGTVVRGRRLVGSWWEIETAKL